MFAACLLSSIAGRPPIVQLAGTFGWLREKVGRVLFPVDHEQAKLRSLQPPLKPETTALKVPQLAQSLTASGAHRCLAIRPDPEGQAHAHVTEESLKAQANAGGAHDAVVFGFAAAQGQACLSG